MAGVAGVEDSLGASLPAQSDLLRGDNAGMSAVECSMACTSRLVEVTPREDASLSGTSGLVPIGVSSAVAAGSSLAESGNCTLPIADNTLLPVGSSGTLPIASNTFLPAATGSLNGSTTLVAVAPAKQGDDAKPLAGVSSVQLPAAFASQSLSGGAGASVGISRAPPRPLSDTLYDSDCDSEGGASAFAARRLIAPSPGALSDASGFDNTLGYSCSLAASGRHDSAAGRADLEASLRSLGLTGSLANCLAASATLGKDSLALSHSNRSVAASQPAASNDGVLDAEVLDAFSEVSAAPSGPAEPHPSPIPATSPLHKQQLEPGQLEDFTKALRAASGLGGDLQDELIQLLQHLPTDKSG